MCLLASLGLPTLDMLPQAATPLHPAPPHGQYPLDPDPVQSARARQDQELLLLQEQATHTRKAIDEIKRHATAARGAPEVSAAASEANRIALAERREADRLAATLKAQQERQAAAYREATIRAEAERLAHASKHAKERALRKANDREQQRAHEAARRLKAAQEAEHARVVQEASDMACILRREEVLLAARMEAAPLATTLADA